MTHIYYNEEIEAFFKAEGEKCETMSILHLNSYKTLHNISLGINIPVIILSSAVGFLAQINLETSYQPIILGGLSMLVGVFKTVDVAMSFNARAESHKQSSIQYTKINKLISVQLALERSNRINAKDLLEYITNDLQSLRENEEIIDDTIITSFKKRYASYVDVSKPNIVNGLTSIDINTHETGETPRIGTIAPRIGNSVVQPVETV